MDEITFSRTSKQLDRFGKAYWWDNCKRDCRCADPNIADENCTCKGGNCARGSADRMQKEDYAKQVLFYMGNWDGISQFAICPLTGKEFDLACGEVDKVYENRRYTEFNIVYVSLQGNQERATLQQWSNDIAGQTRYAQDVAKASALASVTQKARLVKPAYAKRGRHNYDTVTMAERPAKDAHNVRFGPYGK